MKAERRLQNYLIRGSHSFTVLSIAALCLSLFLSLSIRCTSRIFLTVYFQYPHLSGLILLNFQGWIWRFSPLLPHNLTQWYQSVCIYYSSTHFPHLTRGFHGNHSTGWPVDALILHGAIGSVCTYHQMHRLVGFIYQGFYIEAKLYPIYASENIFM